MPHVSEKYQVINHLVHSMQFSLMIAQKLDSAFSLADRKQDKFFRSYRLLLLTAFYSENQGLLPRDIYRKLRQVNQDYCNSYHEFLLTSVKNKCKILQFGVWLCCLFCLHCYLIHTLKSPMHFCRYNLIFSGK